MKDLIGNKTMYRGARTGDPKKLKGPSYFTSFEPLAKTYGPTAAFKLNLKNPKVLSAQEWKDGPAMLQFSGGTAGKPAKKAIEALGKAGYDGLVSTMGPVVLAYVFDPKVATLVEGMSLNSCVANLISGCGAREVVEAIDATATSYAALMMRHGASEKKAVKTAVKLIGHEPDDEILHMAAKPEGSHKDSKAVRHWMKQGHYDTKRTPKYLDASGNSIDD